MESAMFSYYGSHLRLAKYYPPPQYSVIVEPFAGSAGYSTYWWRRTDEDINVSKVILADSYDKVAAVWKYLLGATKEEILSLPEGPFFRGNPIDELDIPEAAKFLIGFWETQSQAYPSRWQQSPRHRGGLWTKKKREVISNQVEEINGNWEFVDGDAFDLMRNLKDEDAMTWHIDPPYEVGGKRYKKNEIDHEELSRLVLELVDSGHQVMVCEREPAAWISEYLGPYEFLTPGKNKNASNREYREIVWRS